MKTHFLDLFFAPQSISAFGASKHLGVFGSRVFDNLPKAEFSGPIYAVNPYPNYLVSELQLADGTHIKIRPIRPEDASIEQRFVRELSPQTRYYRFMHSLKELPKKMLVRFTQLDYNRELALIAVLELAGEETELGVARYVMNPDGESCEFALVVADKWQHKGIGSHLMSALIEAARQSGIKVMAGDILAINSKMLALARRLGFSIHTNTEDLSIKAVSRRL